jgi:C4-dicarboxylate-specific signal transduction histidine kinase
MRGYHAGDGYDRETGEFGPNYAWRCPSWQPGDRSRTRDISNTTVRDLRGERRLEHHRRLEAVGRLASGVAHELNNPLLMVVGNAEMLLGMKLATAARRRAERVLAGARRCQDVVDGLLRLRIKRKEVQEIVELEPLVRGVVRLLAGEFPSPQAQLELPDEVLRVRGDAVDLKQAVGHLLRNAFQAVEGRPHSEVKLRLGRELDMARITVEDNGPGMSPDVLGRAFEPFFTTREVGKGKGLGLSIAMGVVQDHGGFLELHCHAGGTVAAISLPLIEAHR